MISIPIKHHTRAVAYTEQPRVWKSWRENHPHCGRCPDGNTVLFTRVKKKIIVNKRKSIVETTLCARWGFFRPGKSIHLARFDDGVKTCVIAVLFLQTPQYVCTNAIIFSYKYDNSIMYVCFCDVSYYNAIGLSVPYKPVVSRAEIILAIPAIP